MIKFNHSVLAPEKLRRCFFVFIGLLACLCSFSSEANYVVLPADSHKVIHAAYDKSTGALSDLFVWYDHPAGRLETDWQDDPYDVRRMTFLCQSKTDTSTGACETQPTWADIPVDSNPIRVKFTEQRSGAQFELTAGAWLFVIYQGGGGSWRAINDPVPDSRQNVGRSLQVRISAEQLNRLPRAGVWKGKIQLRQSGWKSLTVLATYVADITIEVADKDNIQIYFPDGDSNPNVDLNLVKRATANDRWQVAGEALLDMCLYDGYGANSSSYEVRVSDPNVVAGRGNNLFSVGHESTGVTADPSTRVDYTVTMDYNGSHIPLINNETEILSGINSARTREVNMPNIPGTVLCSPTPLTLKTEGFDILSKRAGAYSGTLRVEFTPVSTVP